MPWIHGYLRLMKTITNTTAMTTNAHVTPRRMAWNRCTCRLVVIAVELVGVAPLCRVRHWDAQVAEDVAVHVEHVLQQPHQGVVPRLPQLRQPVPVELVEHLVKHTPCPGDNDRMNVGGEIECVGQKGNERVCVESNTF